MFIPDTWTTYPEELRISSGPGRAPPGGRSLCTRKLYAERFESRVMTLVGVVLCRCGLPYVGPAIGVRWPTVAQKGHRYFSTIVCIFPAYYNFLKKHFDFFLLFPPVGKYFHPGGKYFNPGTFHPGGNTFHPGGNTFHPGGNRRQKSKCFFKKL